MYAFIKGILVSKEDNILVIENNNIGYQIQASLATIESIGNIDETVKVYTYLHVKEDEMSLYGFSSIAEKQMFLKLTTISGIGPKMAITILSNINLSDLALAIVSNDASLLYKVKGIGKKTADRIVLELNEKLDDVEQYETKNNTKLSASEIDDAIAGLMALGMNRIDAVKRVRSVAESGDRAEDIIAKALKN